MKTSAMATGKVEGRTARRPAAAMILMAFLVPGFFLAGCSDDDCLNCVDVPAPVVPTGVHSISGDGYVIVQWHDLVYPPYDGSYNESLVAYEVYRRDYEFGDENDPDRLFDPTPIAVVPWNENYDPGTGLHRYDDENVFNGLQYEYAVASVNAAGVRSALSFEFVVDAPLPMSPLDSQGWFVPLPVYDANAQGATAFGFEFRRAALSPQILAAGRVTPGVEVTVADIEVFFNGGVPYVRRGASHVELQDMGDFSDSAGNLYFEAVGWAPARGYSATGTLELVAGHVYVVKISGSGGDHYAKFGVDSIGAGLVNLVWAYQLIANLPELSAPAGDDAQADDGPRFISL
ncbi:MAG: hypothetical protein IPK64_07955 [bacterium]|nr:hypothetical protein [bacterium]